MSDEAEVTSASEKERLVQEREIIRADQDAQAIKACENAPWFRAWWMRRLMEDRAKLVQTILIDSAIEKIPEHRAVIKFIDQLVSRPTDDKNACLNLLKVHQERMEQDD